MSLSHKARRSDGRHDPPATLDSTKPKTLLLIFVLEYKKYAGPHRDRIILCDAINEFLQLRLGVIFLERIS
ncbi:hypothetical protein Y043_5076 [Burkholderia pseudomallei MSHR2138]|nr:hypothetical protein Y602_4591 [Burkholderia pseudomallei MSHR733]KGX45509.1 hypothetical protein Y043_5076 [Burkholderia pseudomallei MSHR2138]KGX48008.1 hypothetical protein Y600_6066 [Burkholderia pseudomallei MSHR3709]